VFLSQAESTRQSRSTTVAMAAGSAVAIAGANFSLNVASGESTMAAIALFGLSFLAITVSMALILMGVQPRPPERLLMFGDRVASRIKRLFRVPTTTPAATRSG
jgi:hypothetical protein